MTKKEYTDQLSSFPVDEAKVRKLEKVYGAKFPLQIQRIISNNAESIFFDDGSRVISYVEMVDAESDLHVDFKNNGIIPLVDCGENDFIVYHFLEGIWSKFNITDETTFKKRSSIEELLK